MKRTITCLLLALCLLMMSAAALADSDYTFDIGKGDITIVDGSTTGTIKVLYGNGQTKDNIDPSQEITVTGTTAEDELHIRTATPVQIKASNLTIQLTKEGATPMSIEGTGDVTLILEGVNTLSTEAYQAGIDVDADSRLTIQGDGALFAIGGYSGIGSTEGGQAGTIIINIGSNGGVRAQGSSGSHVGPNAKLVLTGGVLAMGSSTGSTSNEFDILICTDGTIEGRLALTWNAGIYPTPDTENSLLVTGVKAEDGSPPYVSADLTLPVDLTIPAGKTLTIPEGSSLIIPEGKTLTIPEGATLIISEGAALTVGGELSGGGNIIGTVSFTVKLHPNGGKIAEGCEVTGYTYGEWTPLPTAADVTRPGYAFAGWYDNEALEGGYVPAITAYDMNSKEYWAKWIALPVITSPERDTTVTVYEGEQATMTITAQNAASYQWRMSTDGGKTWTDCGGDSPTYTTSPTELKHNGYLYKCVVTGSDELKELPDEDWAPAEMALRSASRSTDDGIEIVPDDDQADDLRTVESPIFTLEVIQKGAIPETGDSSRIGLWLALGLAGIGALAGITLRGRKKRAE